MQSSQLRLNLFSASWEEFFLDAIDLSSYDRIVIFLSGGKDSVCCLLIVRYLLEKQGLQDKIEVEAWHHCVDGREEGLNLMDWAYTESYCQKLCDAFNIKLYFSWLEGGMARELVRENQAKSRTWFETPDGLMCAGGNSKDLTTRLNFPQTSNDLNVRWCSPYLKIDVGRIAVRNQKRFKGSRTLLVSGERAEESPKRAKYLQIEPDETHCASRYVDRWRPVHHIDQVIVWQIIQYFGVNPAPSYLLGFGRKSCRNCIFNGDDEWATLRQIDPEGFARILAFELLFQKTIFNSKLPFEERTIEARANRGTPFPNMQPDDIRAALSSTFDRPILLPPDKWKLPAGAFGRNCGPT
jgi:3'-phosphoadenosine 5'-phosphosulfate sulfotransferase (PAPS reductase)/FAD synthetase